VWPRQDKKVCNGIDKHPSTSGGQGDFVSLSEKLPSLEMASSISGVDFKSQLTHLDQTWDLREKTKQTISLYLLGASKIS